MSLRRRRPLPPGFDYTRWLVEKERSQLADYLPQPPFKESERADGAVERILAGYGIKFSADENTIQREWIEIVGHDIAQRTMPGTLENASLSVFVMGSAWLAELRRNRIPDMVRRINAHFGREVVKTISLRHAPHGYKTDSASTLPRKPPNGHNYN